MKYSDLRFAFVKLIYADHNKSAKVKKALEKCIARLKDNEVGLNVGAGTTALDKRIRNLDIFPGEHIYYVAKAEAIPEKDNFFGIIITQEVLEHVQDPFKAISEIYRVLKPGGTLYCQLPFIIGYHPGPTDFWRFTKEGITELVTRVGFEVEEIGITVEVASGFYRIAVEFFAVLFSMPLSFLYHPLKAVFSLALYPIKFLDYILQFSKQADRIPGGYYVIAKK
jgi:SAM-dependent methyltransferase